MPDSHPMKRLIIKALETTPKSHKSAIHLLLGRDELFSYANTNSEVIHPFPGRPWDTPLGTIANIENPREKVKTQVEQLRRDGVEILFTDGSFMENVGSAAAAVTDHYTRRVSLGPKMGISKYEAEAWGSTPTLKQTAKASSGSISGTEPPTAGTSSQKQDES
ncbi:hypothetical protein CROQUDRAFT_95329 [Cronartium quercuum f. sp. fusiforme G11]|uniref:Uncharacterized protein n=1 Tax=Cronartium quercuum f. sp. fusiforme G11 TaxID=708437 RepID=A0A9P6TA22_9BASI|nr:hypothetical protein CROQUDRAFT_95329 [Cronartium quercuum f. sp. fusiforme G11]